MYKKIVNRGKRRHKTASFGVTDETFQTLGDKIIAAAKYGADIGVTTSVEYDVDVEDDSDKHDVDILSDPNHDFFDIAEKFGHMVEQGAPPVGSNNDNNA